MVIYAKKATFETKKQCELLFLFFAKLSDLEYFEYKFQKLTHIWHLFNPFFCPQYKFAFVIE